MWIEGMRIGEEKVRTGQDRRMWIEGMRIGEEKVRTG